MIKINLYIFVSSCLLSYSTFANTLLKLDQEMIMSINDHLSETTSNCNFSQSTKYYYGETKFFNYSVVDNKEVVQEQSYSEAMSEFKVAMDSCYVSLAKEKPISEKIEISESGQEAIFNSEALHYLKSTDGRFFESHNKGKTIFKIVDGKVKIVETHYKGLSIKEIEKVP
ncbi:hypothetical protein FE810_15215 [Thalassotalea litorea]|uniref:Uncharacterized protein n=1 Tax=Thalassotalea litorea TaxID=2020715 RepID=A0A5R9IMZ4_9GAMM|nr:hypothetical protein [Thalassotalea litorea]TLU61359.1 hypothetical protein FE810_15215 [Thalassotalea litorea]